jgi:VanZ family protein
MVGPGRSGPAPGRPTPETPVRAGRYLAWTALYLAFVIYGSLIPFRFRALPFADAWRQFLDIPFLTLGLAHRADWVANILLYVPLGVLLAALLSLRLRPSLAAAAAFALGGAVAVTLEFAQLYFPRRTVSLNDILAEVLGSGLGALFWLGVRHRLGALRHVLSAPGERVPRILALLYAIAYLAFAFFPLDFLVSVQELRWKLAGGYVGWWQAARGCARGLSCPGTRATEVLAALPLGAGLGLWLPPKPWGAGLARAVRLGLGLGFVIEGLQFFTASNITQVASAVSRGMGVALGYILYRLALHEMPSRSLRLLRRPAGAIAASVIYLSTSLALALPGKGPWLDWQAIGERLAQMPFLPFYYHYYTSETRALESFLLNFALYLPIGMLARGIAAGPPTRGRAWASAGLGALWGLALEAAKLGLRQGRPDPTNVLVAAAGAMFGYWLAVRLLPGDPGETPPAAGIPAETAADASSATRTSS